MRRPDIRQRVIEAVLDLAADAGVDDVHLIAALALHRRMHESELRHALGDRVYDAFAAARCCCTSTTPKTPTTSPTSAPPPHGEDVEINKRAAESDLLVYVNINLVAMDGGWKSTAVGLASTDRCATTTTPITMEASAQLHGPAHAASCTRARGGWARSCVDSRRQGLPDRDHAEHRHVPAAVRVPVQAGVGVECTRPGDLPRRPPSRSTGRRPRLARKIFHCIEAPHQTTSIQCGEVEAVHQSHDRERLPPAARRGARARPTSSRWGSPTSARTTSTRS